MLNIAINKLGFFFSGCVDTWKAVHPRLPPPPCHNKDIWEGHIVVAGARETFIQMEMVKRQNLVGLSKSSVFI